MRGGSGARECPVKFWECLQGLSRRPKESFSVPGAKWLEHMKVLWTADEACRCEGFEAREHAFEIAMHAVPVLIGQDHRLQDTAPRLTSTEQVIELIADLDAAGVSWTTVPPLGDGPRSLAEHSEYLEWAAAEVMPAFRHPVI